MTTYKADVIEKLFFDKSRWSGNDLKNPIVTLDEISKAIVDYNHKHRTKHSTRNPANFFKDFIRNRTRANLNWPAALRKRRFSARQITGGGNAFIFEPYTAGQEDPFPETIGRYADIHRAPAFKIQSVSLPIMARLLGRQDETWLMQVAVRLFLVETHLALCSVQELEHVDHLQMGVKLAKTEIDALYLGKKKNGDEVIVTVEAKGLRDDILEDQVLAQAKSALGMKSLRTKQEVIPMAIKVIGPSTIYVREYVAFKYGAETPAKLDVASEAVYELKPKVPGIK